MMSIPSQQPPSNLDTGITLVLNSTSMTSYCQILVWPIQNVRAGIADANRVLGSTAPEAEKAEARIELEVYEGLQAALAK